MGIGTGTIENFVGAHIGFVLLFFGALAVCSFWFALGKSKDKRKKDS
ncbi:hypothetical protein G0R39_004488 [Salmonella enterica]|nr:hypothetical protein [Salmonella enterica]